MRDSQLTSLINMHSKVSFMSYPYIYQLIRIYANNIFRGHHNAIIKGHIHVVLYQCKTILKSILLLTFSSNYDMLMAFVC